MNNDYGNGQEALDNLRKKQITKEPTNIIDLTEEFKKHRTSAEVDMANHKQAISDAVMNGSDAKLSDLIQAHHEAEHRATLFGGLAENGAPRTPEMPDGPSAVGSLPGSQPIFPAGPDAQKT